MTAPTAIRTGHAVATAHPLATEAALEMLRAGGNAADAAAAAAWTLAVVEPSGSGLGGQATLLVHTSTGSCTVLDGHSHAPRGATRRAVDRTAQRKGFRATTVPSMPATVGALGERFGRLPLARVLEPARRAAEEGFAVSPLLRRHVQWCAGALAATDFGTRTFLPGGKAPRRGTVLRQAELAATLERLARHGVADFYTGGLAREIADDMRTHEGLVGLDDLASAAHPAERAALSMNFLGHEVVTVPPPGGGLSLLLGLRLAEALSLDEAAGDDALWYERFALVVDAVFRERTRWPLPAERFEGSFLAWMLGPEHAGEIAAEALARAPRPRVARPDGPGDTTHLCVADADGMVVSLTQSVQSLFGAKVANERLGFFYNNYLCTCSRRRGPARLRSGARPQSNAAPTVVFRGPAGTARTPWFTLGATTCARARAAADRRACAPAPARSRTPPPRWCSAGPPGPHGRRGSRSVPRGAAASRRRSST